MPFYLSGMFQGHGHVDLELRLEQSAWLSGTCVEDNSILLLDSALRIAHHWNTEYCISAASCVEKGRERERGPGGLGLSYNLDTLGLQNT